MTSQKTNLPKLCLALDMEQKEDNLALCRELKKSGINTQNIYMKVGLRSFIRDGIPLLGEIQELGFKIFLDLKLYDIPNTMLDSLQEVIKIGIDIITIHASSGVKAMNMLSNELKRHQNPPLIFGISVLTSFSDDEFRAVYNLNINDAVQNFAKLAAQSGLDGVVCSCLESKDIKKNFSSLLTLTPGIRPSVSEVGEGYNISDDQARVADISFAKKCLCDFVVIGRPIYKSENPAQMTQKILEKLNEK